MTSVLRKDLQIITIKKRRNGKYQLKYIALYKKNCNKVHKIIIN